MSHWLRKRDEFSTSEVIRDLIIFAIGIALGVGAALSMNAAEGTTKAMVQPTAQMECPGDMQGCNKGPRWHRDKFRAGKIRPVVKQVRYPRYLKRQILRRVRREWNNQRRVSYPGHRPVWRNITSDDNCVQRSYPANTLSSHCQKRRAYTRADQKRLVDVLLCGGEIALFIATKTPKFAIGAGGALCGFHMAAQRLD